MSFVGYIITYRESGSLERRENLKTVLAWLATLQDIEVVVIEQDEKPRLDPLEFPSARVCFYYNPGAFNKAWGFNIGAQLLNTPVYAFGDADILVPHSWAQAVDLMRGDYAAIKPYVSLVDLTEAETKQIREFSVEWLPERANGLLTNREHQGEYLPYAGGLFLVRRSLFFKVAGFDERFIGWGGEDDAMTSRLQASGELLGGIEHLPALHLWHPRLIPQLQGQDDYSQNLRILADYKRYTPQQYQRLFEVQRCIMANADKYRPDRILSPTSV